MVLIFLCICLSCIGRDWTPHLQNLETNGFTVVSEVFTKEEIVQAAQEFASLRSQALELIETTPAQIRYFGENNQDHASLYWKKGRQLILQAGPGRYDFYQGFQQGFFGSKNVLHNDALEELMRHLMGEEFTNYSGMINSLPDSADQYWHRDTHTLSNYNTDGSKLIALDDFYFTILIPITVPFTLENGTTEFLAGSHRLSAHDFDRCEPVQLEVPLGSALIFNGKINHRGKGNRSDTDRPALYIVYHKKWYNDQYRRGVRELTSIERPD